MDDRAELRKRMSKDVPLSQRVDFAVRYNFAKMLGVQRMICHPVFRAVLPAYEGLCDSPTKFVLGKYKGA
jgi:hypothetical protein